MPSRTLPWHQSPNAGWNCLTTSRKPFTICTSCQGVQGAAFLLVEYNLVLCCVPAQFGVLKNKDTWEFVVGLMQAVGLGIALYAR